MRPTLFHGSSLNWQHIAASCAVPVFLRHYPINGEFFTDGGLVDPLPLRAAIDLGATRIITVNLLKNRPWFIRCIVRAVRACTGYRLPDRKRIEVVDISPSVRLGNARESIYWSSERTRRWIEQGIEDADRAAAQVVEWQQKSEGQGRISDDASIPHPSPEGECTPVVPVGSAYGGTYTGESEGVRARPLG